MKILALIGLLWIGWLIGWRHAHVAVALECERLGGFYVGKTVYRCTSVNQEPLEPVDE
jgi:hypothetical protein